MTQMNTTLQRHRIADAGFENIEHTASSKNRVNANCITQELACFGTCDNRDKNQTVDGFAAVDLM
jgi:hypothetical protein